MRTSRVFIISLFAVSALILSACGDSTTQTASPTTTKAPATTAPPATEAPATTEAPTTEAPATTDAPTTTAAAPVSPLPIGAATGQWNNDTFGSTGKAVATVDQTENTMSVTLDLTDGMVLGQGISDIFFIDLPIDQLASGVTIETDALGTLHITIADGKIDVVGTNSPVQGIAGFTATGTITETSLSGTYEVQFDVGDPAVGTFDYPLG